MTLEELYKISDNFQGMIVVSDKEYVLGQILYDGDEWIYLTCIGTPYFEFSDYALDNLIKNLKENYRITQLLIINFNGENAERLQLD